VDVLKLFIVSVKSALYPSSESSTISSRQQIVTMVNACPVNTAGRPLELEEIQLRTTWIYAVALMLDHVAYDNMDSGHSGTRCVDDATDAVAEQVQSTYGPILTALAELKRNGGTLKTQEFVQQYKSVLPATIHVDDVQLAIVSQTIKVLWYTLVVLDEERLANDTTDVAQSPHPPIPRGNEIN
jgi:hypothetical protein